MNDIKNNLNNLMILVNNLKGNPVVDVRVKNKIGSLLWEARLLAEHLVKPSAAADQASLDKTATVATAFGICICPEGAIDKNCPKHKDTV